MSWFSINRGAVIHTQIRDGILGLIAGGALPPGTRLPSSRSLAGMLGVSRNAVVEAYDALMALGVLQTRPKSGTYVTDSARDVANFGPVVPRWTGCWLASYMNARGVECSEENILVVAGYQQGIALIARALLNPAETALVEDPTYPDTRSALQFHGAMVQGIPIGKDGPDVDMLTEVVPSQRPKLFCVTPLWQNPTAL